MTFVRIYDICKNLPKTFKIFNSTQLKIRQVPTGDRYVNNHMLRAITYPNFLNDRLDSTGKLQYGRQKEKLIGKSSGVHALLFIFTILVQTIL